MTRKSVYGPRKVNGAAFDMPSHRVDLDKPAAALLEVEALKLSVVARALGLFLGKVLHGADRRGYVRRRRRSAWRSFTLAKRAGRK